MFCIEAVVGEDCLWSFPFALVILSLLVTIVRRGGWWYQATGFAHAAGTVAHAADWIGFAKQRENTRSI